MTREMLFALALGYLLGSISFGLVLTRLAGEWGRTAGTLPKGTDAKAIARLI